MHDAVYVLVETFNKLRKKPDIFRSGKKTGSGQQSVPLNNGTCTDYNVNEGWVTPWEHGDKIPLLLRKVRFNTFHILHLFDEVPAAFYKTKFYYSLLNAPLYFCILSSLILHWLRIQTVAYYSEYDEIFNLRFSFWPSQTVSNTKRRFKHSLMVKTFCFVCCIVKLYKRPYLPAKSMHRQKAFFKLKCRTSKAPSFTFNFFSEE